MKRYFSAIALLASCTAGDIDKPDFLVARLTSAKTPLELANANFSLLCSIDAERWALKALQSNEKSLEAQYLIAASQAARGEYDRAQTVATKALSDADADSPGHIRSALIGLLVAIRLEVGDARGAESVLLSHEPRLANAAEAPIATSFEALPAPPHAIQYLAITRELAGDESEAMRLRAHFSFITKDYLAARAGGALRPADYWMLASFGAGKMTAHEAAANLGAAWAGGFREGWPFNFGMHASLYPFKGSPEFKVLFERIEADVTASRSAVYNVDQTEIASRGFNGMAITARECVGASPE